MITERVLIGKEIAFPELSSTRTPAHSPNAEQLRFKIAVESSRGRATVVFDRLHPRLWSAQFSFNITASALDPTGSHMKSSAMVRLPTKPWTKERVSLSVYHYLRHS